MAMPSCGNSREPMYLPWLLGSGPGHGKSVDVRDVALATRVMALVERTAGEEEVWPAVTPPPGDKVASNPGRPSPAFSHSCGEH